MQVDFSDLIPPETQSLSFDDLIPQKRKQSRSAGVLDSVVNGLTFGFGDEIVAAEAALLGKTPDGDTFNYELPFRKRYQAALKAEQAQNQAFREDRPVSAFVGELAGSVLSGGATINAGARAAQRAAPNVTAKIASTLKGRMAASAGAGAALGAVSAVGNDTDVTSGALIGALGGGAGQAVGEVVSSGVRAVGRALRKKPNVPSVDDIRGVERAAYQEADNAGVVLTPQAMKRLRDQASQELADMAYDPAVDAKVGAAMRRVDELQGQNVTLRGLRPVRKAAGRAAGSIDREERRMGVLLKNQIDDIVTSPVSGDVLTGDAQKAADALKVARDMSTRRFKSEAIEKALDDAISQAGVTGSGGNVDNATRQKIRRVLQKQQNYTPDEVEAAERAMFGSTAQNNLRLAGKLSPSGNGLMAALNVGAASINPAFLGLTAAGMASKSAADAMTKSNVEALSRIIRAGGSKVAAEGAPNMIERASDNPRLRQMIARAILASSMQQQVAP